MSNPFYSAAKATSLEELQRVLAKANAHDAELFREIIIVAPDLLHLPLKALADEFGVSPASITRWRQGKNVPHATVRKMLYSWMNKRVANVLRRRAGSPLQASQRSSSRSDDFTGTRNAHEPMKDQRTNASAVDYNAKAVYQAVVAPIVAESGGRDNLGNYSSKLPSWEHKTPGSQTPSSTTPSSRRAA
jgi:hypothetical protein